MEISAIIFSDNLSRRQKTCRRYKSPLCYCPTIPLISLRLKNSDEDFGLDLSCAFVRPPPKMVGGTNLNLAKAFRERRCGARYFSRWIIVLPCLTTVIDITVTAVPEKWPNKTEPNTEGNVAKSKIQCHSSHSGRCHVPKTTHTVPEKRRICSITFLFSLRKIEAHS